jgi:uncharacterized membrane protein YjfL (UPF0719 family)
MLDHLQQGLISAVVFSLVGIAVFGAAFLVIAKLVPFSMRKEIEVDQNTSLAILIGSAIIGLSIIIAAAIHG